MGALSISSKEIFFPLDISRLSYEQLKSFLKDDFTIGKIKRIAYRGRFSCLFKMKNKASLKIDRRVLASLSCCRDRISFYLKFVPISFFLRDYSYKILSPEIFFQNHRLVKSINQPDENTNLVIKTKIPVNAFIDERLGKFAKSHEVEVLDFAERDVGYCVGSCERFLYLYFSTLKIFPDEERHLRCIASEFTHGASFHATILQFFHFLNLDEHMRLSIGPCNTVCEYYSQNNKWRVYSYLEGEAFKKFLGSLPKNEVKDLQPVLENFPDNCIYAVDLEIEYFDHSVIRHRIVLKKGENFSYIFDPNEGLLKIKTKNLSFSLNQIVSGFSKEKPKEVVYDFFHNIPR